MKVGDIYYHKSLWSKSPVQIVDILDQYILYKSHTVEKSQDSFWSLMVDTSTRCATHSEFKEKFVKDYNSLHIDRLNAHIHKLEANAKELNEEIYRHKEELVNLLTNNKGDTE